MVLIDQNLRFTSSALRYLEAGAALTALFFIGRCIYLIFFHPLAKYPGPLIAAISDVGNPPFYLESFNDSQTYYGYIWVSGEFHTRMQSLHLKYGDIVRIAPNELAFASATSWKDIYGIPTAGKNAFTKTPFYGIPGTTPTIFTAQDPKEHSKQRRTLAHAFSGSALQAQEPIIHKYVDLFIQQIGKLGAPGGKGLNVTEAFNWLSFDVIGDLTFSESFDAVAQARTHPWMALIGDAGRLIMISNILKRAPLVYLFLHNFLPKDFKKRYAQHAALTREKTKKRIELGAEEGREDFFTDILRRGSPPYDEMEQQSIQFIIAGSETTATALTAQTYFLLRNPACLQRLQDDVRSAFTSANQITGQSTAQIPYLIGVIEEGLRLFPPIVSSPPRFSPGDVVDGHYIPAGITVATNIWVTARDPRYWYEPEKFLPERWIGDRFGDNKQASRPFLLGARGCIGMNLAYVEMRITLAKLVFTYDMEFAPSSRDLDFVKRSTFPVLWVKPELKVIFNPRKIGARE